jgi:hypothetical protein
MDYVNLGRSVHPMVPPTGSQSRTLSVVAD